MVFTRTPYFLFAALAVPIVDIIAWLLFGLIDGLRHPTSGGNIGGYDLSGLGILISVAGVSVVAGLLFSVTSLWRNERGRSLALICAVIYALPVLWAATHVLGFGQAKGRYDRFEASQKTPPSN